MTWSIAFNIVTILVMVGVLYYAFRLDRRLSALDKNRAEMEKFVQVFSENISRAERGVQTLKRTAEDANADVERSLTQATSLRDELNFLIDAADKIATRITSATSQAQSDALARRPATLMPEPAKSVAEEKPEVTKTVKPAPVPKDMQAPRAEPPAITLSTPADASKLPSWLKSLRPMATAPAKADAPAPVKSEAAKETNADAPKDLRSQAERELQQALEKMR